MEDLCIDGYATLAPCFGPHMMVMHLTGKDEAGWEAFVRNKGGPESIVSAWLKAYGLRRFCEGYVSPTMTKKAKASEEALGGSLFFPLRGSFFSRSSHASPDGSVRGDDSSSSHSSPRTVVDLLTKVLGRRSPEVSNVSLNSMEDVARYLNGAHEKLRPHDNGARAASDLLKVDVPLNIHGTPDFLRLPLPATFACQKRANTVLNLLRGKHVLAAAVSGAGKTRLAFDLAQRQYALYFDMNGGHGKVKQMDVKDFFERCATTAAHGSHLERERVLTVFDRVIASLILSRWAVLAVALHRGNDNLKPAQWLWMQTDDANLFDASFVSCLRLSDEGRKELLHVIRPVVTPIVLLDEAQELLIHDECFRSRRGSGEKRPLGYRVLQWLEEHDLKSFVSGTNMRLQNFSLLRSAVGQAADNDGSEMWYDFDFLGLTDDDDGGALTEYCCHVLQITQEDVALIMSSLQGRPRFAAAAIFQAIMAQAKTLEDLARCVNEYVKTQISSTTSTTVRGTWERLHGGKDKVTLDGEPVFLWTLARNMLLQSIYERGVIFRTNLERELVSRGITMLDTQGENEFMAEPLVLSAGLSFFLSANVDIARPLVERFHDLSFTDPQHRGKLLELLAAARLYEKPNRLQSLPGWPESLELPSHPPRGVLVNVSLTDERVGLKNLDEKPVPYQEEYWITLPEVHAGPDLVMPRLVISFKFTSHAVVSAEESRKSIKTITPTLFYTKAGGELYASGVWCKKHNAVVEQAKLWKGGIARVRVELPAAAPSMTPEHVVASDGKDTLVYLHSGNAKVLLGENLL